jgi:DNA-binding MarR family transcriptional regulator
MLILDNFLPYRLNRLAAAISLALKEIYGRDYGLTIPEWRVLATLGQFGEMSATAIGEHSSMHKTKVSRAVQGLEKRRWMRRRENAGDRRGEILSLTSRGLDSYRSICPRMLAFEEEVARKLGSAENIRLLSSLTALERALKIASSDPKEGISQDPDR